MHITYRRIWRIILQRPLVSAQCSQTVRIRRSGGCLYAHRPNLPAIGATISVEPHAVQGIAKKHTTSRWHAIDFVAGVHDAKSTTVANRPLKGGVISAQHGQKTS